MHVDNLKTINMYWGECSIILFYFFKLLELCGQNLDTLYLEKHSRKLQSITLYFSLLLLLLLFSQNIH